MHASINCVLYRTSAPLKQDSDSDDTTELPAVGILFCAHACIIT